jgi:predicted CopG family antitoxin
VTLEAEVYEQLKAIAKAENRSLSNLIESWVLAELAKRKA